MARTLLLSPPSLSSRQEKLNDVLEMHDRTATDMQMLDRLSRGLASLPESTYDVILVLTDADGTRRESQSLLNREIVALLVRALKPSGRLRSQDGQLGATVGQEHNEAILAGLNLSPQGGFIKPDYGTQSSVPLKLASRKKDVAQAAGGLNGSRGGALSLPVNGATISPPLNGKRKSQDISNGTPVGLGFVDFSDDFGEPEVDSDDDLIDEDMLLTEEDLKRPVKIRES